MTETSGRCLVLCIGHPDRGDDAAGRAVARRLNGTLPAGVTLVEEDGDALSILVRLEGVQTAFLVDACVSGAPAGTIRRLDVSRAPLPKDAFGISTHGLGVVEAIEIARTVGRLPHRCVIYAIEGASFEIGEPLSPGVAQAVEEVVGCLRTELEG
ncbi:MAG: hydrogenase maturation protease [Dongiaceae bacterium]